MNSDLQIFERTPSKHRWLGQLLYNKRISQRQLAKLISRDPSQVNHWVSGKEPIPSALFLQSVSAVAPEELRTAEQLQSVHERASLLSSEALALVSEDNEKAALAASKVIVRRAEDSSALLDGDDVATNYQILSTNVGAGIHVLNMMKACKEDNEAFINNRNIRLHLRYPYNVLAGDLIRLAAHHPKGLGEVKAKVIRSMAQTIKSRDDGKQKNYPRQHAYHMLARYGDCQNRNLVLEITASKKDLATRRTALYAEIINDKNPQAADKFIYELEHNKDLASETLDFDFVHYGDKDIERSITLQVLENTFVQNLRHIQTRPGTASAELALHKLMTILKLAGAQEFDRRRINSRIGQIVARLGSMDNVRRTRMEKKFFIQFENLIIAPTHISGELPDKNQLMLALP